MFNELQILSKSYEELNAKYEWEQSLTGDLRSPIMIAIIQGQLMECYDAMRNLLKSLNTRRSS